MYNLTDFPKKEEFLDLGDMLFLVSAVVVYQQRSYLVGKLKC